MLSFVAMANIFFLRNQEISRNSEKDHSRNISVKLHQNWTSSFREVDVKHNVNGRAVGRTDARTTHDGHRAIT